MNATATETTGAPTVTFVSKTNNLRLVKKNARNQPIGESGDYRQIPGEDFQFYDGVLNVSDPDDLAWLRAHGELGKLFHERGAEADRPVEDSSALHKELVELAYDGKFAEIADILTAERSTYSRPDVLAACEAFLTSGGSDVPAKPETPEHELERTRTEPAVGASVPEVVAPGTAGEPVADTPPVAS